MHSWNIYDTFEDASKAAADFIAALIGDAVKKGRECHVILPGGNTPKNCLTRLANKDLPWKKVHWYPGDERCYPQNHADRNDVMLRDCLWSHISPTNIHTIPSELGAEEAAIIYRKLVDQVDIFDIAFLGLGEDGHTASLFPGNVALEDPHSAVPVHDSPKPPVDRISMGINTLKKAKNKVVLTGGSAKKEILARIKAGEELPINRLGDIHWFVDQAASG